MLALDESLERRQHDTLICVIGCVSCDSEIHCLLT